jgi:HAD superfamily hydrolase (TIGR01549 family)
MDLEMMKKPPIDAIIFDIGGTLRVNQATGGRDFETVQKLQAFIGDSSEPNAFAAKLRQREADYRRWCQRTLIELSEADLWSHYMLPDVPTGFVREHAVELNILWRESRFKFILPDAIDTLRTLAARGYTLGIISNTTSSVEGPQLLAENDLVDLFPSVILSSTFGRRKPHPSLFLTAARNLNVLPERCSYVGDQLSRDSVGPRQAGYGQVVLIDIAGYQINGTEPDDDI